MIPSTPVSAAVLMYCLKTGAVGIVISYTKTSPVLSLPTKANKTPFTVPVVTPSGSGPLLSLRPSKEADVPSELKAAAFCVAVICSN